MIRDGLGATCKITDIHRASMSDGYSDVDAIREGFATYEYRRLSDGSAEVSATRFLHEMIDTKYRSWACLGQAPTVASSVAVSDVVAAIGADQGGCPMNLSTPDPVRRDHVRCPGGLPVPGDVERRGGAAVRDPA